MSPKTIFFFCEWSTYPGLKLSRLADEEIKDDRKLIVSMCQGRISPELILEAFKNGAWGVMLASCPPDECEHDGNYKTRRRILLLKNVMKQLGIDPQRLQLEWISKGDTGALNKSISKFESEVAQLGPI